MFSTDDGFFLPDDLDLGAPPGGGVACFLATRGGVGGLLAGGLPRATPLLPGEGGCPPRAPLTPAGPNPPRPADGLPFWFDPGLGLLFCVDALPFETPLPLDTTLGVFSFTDSSPS